MTIPANSELVVRQDTLTVTAAAPTGSTSLCAIDKKDGFLLQIVSAHLRAVEVQDDGGNKKHVEIPDSVLVGKMRFRFSDSFGVKPDFKHSDTDEPGLELLGLFQSPVPGQPLMTCVANFSVDFEVVNLGAGHTPTADGIKIMVDVVAYRVPKGE